jgi:hypothetical protein
VQARVHALAQTGRVDAGERRGGELDQRRVRVLAERFVELGRDLVLERESWIV